MRGHLKLFIFKGITSKIILEVQWFPVYRIFFKLYQKLVASYHAYGNLIK